MNELASAPSSSPSPPPRRFGIAAGIFAVGLGLGFGAGVSYRSATVAPAPESKGAFFCCDQAGKPCVYSPDGDCKVPLKWCPETRRLDDGTVVCVSE